MECTPHSPAESISRITRILLETKSQSWAYFPKSKKSQYTSEIIQYAQSGHEEIVVQKVFYIVVKSTKIQFECTNIHLKWPPSLSIQRCKCLARLVINLQIVSKCIFVTVLDDTMILRLSNSKFKICCARDNGCDKRSTIII